jgi:RHS repeat-associated protein
MESLCNDAPRTVAVPAVQRTSASKPAQNLLTLTVPEINSMRLNDPPMIRVGDALIFEANRSDFTLELFLSNGKEIVTEPLTKADAENTIVAWRKGRAKLDYPTSLNQYVVGMKVTPLHETGEPLLLRSVKIDREGSHILELEKSNPGPQQKQFEPPMSYPQDPRVMTASVTMPTLGREPQGDYVASHIPAFPMQPMVLQSTGGGSDPNHFTYIGQEFDSESGLFHMGARYYSPALGRFTSPDPLYIEMHRLSDPQQLNLYAYGRNNPTTFSDPTGLDIAVNCKDKANCATATDQVNSRKDGTFKVEIGKDGKWHPVGDVDATKLKGAEKAFYDALTDTKTHATLTAVSGDGGVFFGMSTGKGTNTVDVGDTAQLAGAGLSPGNAVAHEAMEAYATAGGADLKDAHNNDPFPGFTVLGSGGRPVINGGNLTGYQYTLRYNSTGATYQVNTTLSTPIPVASFTNPQTRAAAQKAVSTTEQVVGVTATPTPGGTPK